MVSFKLRQIMTAPKKTTLSVNAYKRFMAPISKLSIYYLIFLPSILFASLE